MVRTVCDTGLMDRRERRGKRRYNARTMGPRILQFAKILASGLLFLCLGFGGILFTLLIRPVLAILPGGEERRRRRATAMIHFFFRLFIIGLEGSRILKVHVNGLPEPETLRGTVIISNHPSWLDIVVIISLLPGVVCVVKEAVWRNPFFGSIVRSAGFVHNRDPEETLEAAATAIRKGLSLILFPEGTRTRPGAPLKFQRGAAHLALRTGAPILPLFVRVDPPLLQKGDRWYDVPLRTCQFMVSAEEPIRSEYAVPQTSSPSLRARQLTETLTAFYRQKLEEEREWS